MMNKKRRRRKVSKNLSLTEVSLESISMILQWCDKSEIPQLRIVCTAFHKCLWIGSYIFNKCYADALDHLRCCVLGGTRLNGSESTGMKVTFLRKEVQTYDVDQLQRLYRLAYSKGCLMCSVISSVQDQTPESSGNSDHMHPTKEELFSCAGCKMEWLKCRWCTDDLHKRAVQCQTCVKKYCSKSCITSYMKILPCGCQVCTECYNQPIAYHPI